MAALLNDDDFSGADCAEEHGFHFMEIIREIRVIRAKLYILDSQFFIQP